MTQEIMCNILKNKNLKNKHNMSGCPKNQFKKAGLAIVQFYEFVCVFLVQKSEENMIRDQNEWCNEKNYHTEIKMFCRLKKNY